MVRNVVLVKLRAGTTEEQVATLMAAARGQRIPGLVNLTMGTDLGLRDGNMSFAPVFDFEDEAAYLAYDADEEHNRLRREVLAPITERAERCQYRI